MSDEENCYRSGLAKAFGSSSLMCYNSVQLASRQYFVKHCILDLKALKEVWAEISADIDFMHNARGIQDFKSRCSTSMTKWEAKGIDKATSWINKKGIRHNFILNSKKEWLTARPEWYRGASESLATTNNQCERSIRVAKVNFRQGVHSVTALIKFVLELVRFDSTKTWSDHLR